MHKKLTLTHEYYYVSKVQSLWLMRPRLYIIVTDGTISYRTIISASVLRLSAHHTLHDYFSDKERKKKEHTSVRKWNKCYSHYCLKLNYKFPIFFL